jgi:hypothetical protein
MEYTKKTHQPKPKQKKRSIRGKTAKVCGAGSCWVGGRVIGHWPFIGDRISEPANSCPAAFTIRVLDALSHSVHEIYAHLVASPSIVRCKARARKQLALMSWGSVRSNFGRWALAGWHGSFLALGDQ